MNRPANSVVDRERQFHCVQCGAGVGEACKALRTGRYATVGRTIVPSHVSRKLFAAGKCQHGYKVENCGICVTTRLE